MTMYTHNQRRKSHELLITNRAAYMPVRAGILFKIIISVPGKCAQAIEIKRTKVRIFVLQAASQHTALGFVYERLGMSVEIDTDALDSRR
jgi:hypothetical protein